MSINSSGSRHELEVIKANQMLQDTPTIQHEKIINESIDDPSLQLLVGNLEIPLGKNVPVEKDRHVASFSFIFALLFSLILVSIYWLMVVTVDVDTYGSDRMVYR